MKNIIFILIVLINLANAQIVTGVHDGDSIRIGDLKIRLAAIDAPELKQKYGKASQKALEKLCLGKRAEIQETSKDRYKRTVANVKCQGIDVSTFMVENGHAWVFKRYARKHKFLYALQDGAKAKRLGLWKAYDVVPPWEWRKMKKS